MDRAARFGLGAAALGFAIFGRMSRLGRVAAASFGTAELFTAATRYCPVSRLMGINTCSPQEQGRIEQKTAEKELLGSGI